jgi:hypothetical protein
MTRRVKELVRPARRIAQAARISSGGLCSGGFPVQQTASFSFDADREVLIGPPEVRAFQADGTTRWDSIRV